MLLPPPLLSRFSEADIAQADLPQAVKDLFLFLLETAPLGFVCLCWLGDHQQIQGLPQAIFSTDTGLKNLAGCQFSFNGPYTLVSLVDQRPSD
jgi:hypothetical protein